MSFVAGLQSHGVSVANQGIQGAYRPPGSALKSGPALTSGLLSLMRSFGVCNILCTNIFSMYK